MAGSDREAFAAAMGRVQACYQASRLALRLEELFHSLGYQGPLAVYGPYVRDNALARDPVVLNLALDLSRVSAETLAKLRLAVINMKPAVSIDLFARQHLMAVGYEPQLTNDRFNEETFLKAIVASVPIRINAIGATKGHTLADPQWDFDAYHNRFVLKSGAHLDPAERPEETLEALTSGKYRDWITQHERATDGELEDGLPHGDPADN